MDLFLCQEEFECNGGYEEEFFSNLVNGNFGSHGSRMRPF